MVSLSEYTTLTECLTSVVQSIGSNVLAGASGGFGIFMGLGSAAAGAEMFGGTAAASIYGGALCGTGVGAIIVGGAVVGVAGYRASDAWVNTTPSGIAFTNTLGGWTYGAGKFFGVYNFIVPFNPWKKIRVQIHEPQSTRHYLPVHHSPLRRHLKTR